LGLCKAAQHGGITGWIKKPSLPGSTEKRKSWGPPIPSKDILEMTVDLTVPQLLKVLPLPCSPTLGNSLQFMGLWETFKIQIIARSQLVERPLASSSHSEASGTCKREMF
jgi:hypothetical protein